MQTKKEYPKKAELLELFSPYIVVSDGVSFITETDGPTALAMDNYEKVYCERYKDKNTGCAMFAVGRYDRNMFKKFIVAFPIVSDMENATVNIMYRFSVLSNVFSNTFKWKSVKLTEAETKTWREDIRQGNNPESNLMLNHYLADARGQIIEHVIKYLKKNGNDSLKKYITKCREKNISPFDDEWELDIWLQQ